MGEPSLWNDGVVIGLAPVFGFNPSWESRPSGTQFVTASAGQHVSLFQPLMGEPSLWNSKRTCWG